MKRILPLILTILLIPGMLAVPARADVVPSSNLLNAFDYGFAFDTSNRANLDPNSNRITLGVPLPSPTSTYYADIIVKTDSTTLSLSAFSEEQYFSVIDLGSGLYRFIGNSNKSYPADGFYFHYSDGTYIEVLSYKLSLVPYARYSKTYTGYVYDFSYSPVKETYFSGAGSTPMQAVSIDPQTGGSTIPVGFVTHLEILAWQSMDYLTIGISSWASNIESISVEIGGLPVTYSVNTVENAQLQGVSLFLIDIVVDLTNADRSVSYPVSIDITGQVNRGSSGTYAVQSCLGLISVEPVPSDTFWFTELINSIGFGFSSVGTWISNQTSSLVSWLSQINTSLAVGFDGVSTWLSYVHNSIGSGFSNVSTWISNQTFSITTSISGWGQSLKDSIDALPDKIAEALDALMVPSDSAIQDFGESSQQIAQDRFGGVYEGAMIVDSFAGQLQAQAATQILTVPVVNLNILGTPFPLGGWEVDLVPEGSEVIIEAVKLMIDILATLAFINGIKFRLERTLEQ